MHLDELMNNKLVKEFMKEFGEEKKIVVGKTIEVNGMELTPVFEISVISGKWGCTGTAIPVALHIDNPAGTKITGINTVDSAEYENLFFF